MFFLFQFYLVRTIKKNHYVYGSLVERLVQVRVVVAFRALLVVIVPGMVFGKSKSNSQMNLFSKENQCLALQILDRL